MSAERTPPTIAELLDAAHLLHCGLVWEPQRYPDGPGESERPTIMAAIALSAEFYRSALATPETLPAMRYVHQRTFGADPEEAVSHAMCAVAYHAQILRSLVTGNGAVEDAVGLLTTALGLMLSALTKQPYVHTPFASTAKTDDAEPCPNCGVHHS